MAQLVEVLSQTPKAVGSIPSQGIYPWFQVLYTHTQIAQPETCHLLIFFSYVSLEDSVGR